jgi:hypothetical protein
MSTTGVGTRRPDNRGCVPWNKGKLVGQKPPLTDRRTGNLRAVPLLLGHTKLESTVRYLGVEGDDALAIPEQSDL